VATSYTDFKALKAFAQELALGGNSSPLKRGMPESPGSDIVSQNDTSPSKIPVSTTASPMKNGFF
jgi:hypothetical protein